MSAQVPASSSSQPSDITSHEESLLILPPHWSRVVGPSGETIYLDGSFGTHHEHPLIKEGRLECESKGLPRGWTTHTAAMESGAGGSYYSNEALGVSMWDHPGLRTVVERLCGEAEEDTAAMDYKQGSRGNEVDVYEPSSPPPPPPPPQGHPGVQRMTPTRARALSHVSTHHNTLSASPQATPKSTPYPHPPNTAPHIAVPVHATPRSSKLSNDCVHVNLMNHHRIATFRNRCYRYYPNSAHSLPKPPSDAIVFDVPATDPFAKTMSILQRCPSFLSRILESLHLAAASDENKATSLGFMTHFITHTLLHPYSTSPKYLTDVLLHMLAHANNGGVDFGFLTPDSSWMPAMTPLASCPTATALTSTLLCTSLRSDVLSYMRELVRGKLGDKNSHITYNKSMDVSVTSDTINSSNKRRLKNDETLLQLAGRILDAFISVKALREAPQSIVEIASGIREKFGAESMNVYLLNLVYLPCLPILLADAENETTLPAEYKHFHATPSIVTSWWNQFTSSVSPRQAQFVPMMSRKQFDSTFDCPEWVGVTWVFWRLVQSGFDLQTAAANSKFTRSESIHDPYENGRISPTTHLSQSRVRQAPQQAPDTVFGNDIASSAVKYAPKLASFTTSLRNLSQLLPPTSHHSHPPPLDPVSFDKRLERNTPKCMEICNVLVTCSEELKIVVPIVNSFVNSSDGDDANQHQHPEVLNSHVGESMSRIVALQDDAAYIVHLPLSYDTHGTSNEHGGDDDPLSWPHAPLAPPPPPLPTRSTTMLKARESSDVLLLRQEKREKSLAASMAVALRYKNVLENINRKAILTPGVFDKRSTAAVPQRSKDFKENKNGNLRQQVERVVVMDTNYSSIRVRNLQEYSDPPTIYEQTMKFMGDLRNYSPIANYKAKKLTVSVSGKEYLRPRLDPTKLIELEKNLLARKNKTGEDDFYLMGRDEYGKSTISSFDQKMLEMRKKGFSPGKAVHKPFHKFGQSATPQHKAIMAQRKRQEDDARRQEEEGKEQEQKRDRDILLNRSGSSEYHNPDVINREYALSIGEAAEVAEIKTEAAAPSKFLRRQSQRGGGGGGGDSSAENKPTNPEDVDLLSQQLEALVALVDLGKTVD
jgi:hypothetical protein